MSNNTHDKFPGFSKALEKSSWQFPSIINGFVHSLSGAEFKVLWYILRHTYGWQKNSDYLSLSQICKGIKKRSGEYLDKGTGLSNLWVRKSLISLQEKGFIIVEKEIGKVNKISPRITMLESNTVPVKQSYTVLCNKVTPQYILPITNTNNNIDVGTSIKDKKIDIGKLVDSLSKEERIRYEYQLRGLEIWEALKAPGKKKSEFIRIVRDYPAGLVNEAFSFAKDYPVADIKYMMFFKKLNQLNKNVQTTI